MRTVKFVPVQGPYLADRREMRPLDQGLWWSCNVVGHTASEFRLSKFLKSEEIGERNFELDFITKYSLITLR